MKLLLKNTTNQLFCNTLQILRSIRLGTEICEVVLQSLLLNQPR